MTPNVHKKKKVLLYFGNKNNRLSHACYINAPPHPSLILLSILTEKHFFKSLKRSVIYFLQSKGAFVLHGWSQSQRRRRLKKAGLCVWRGKRGRNSLSQQLLTNNVLLLSANITYKKTPHNQTRNRQKSKRIEDNFLLAPTTTGWQASYSENMDQRKWVTSEKREAERSQPNRGKTLTSTN